MKHYFNHHYKKIDNYQQKFLVTGTIVAGIGRLYVYTHDKDCRVELNILYQQLKIRNYSL
jgi:hypothetical protein